MDHLKSEANYRFVDSCVFLTFLFKNDPLGSEVVSKEPRCFCQKNPTEKSSMSNFRGNIFTTYLGERVFFFQEDAWLEAQQHSTDELLQTHGRFHGNVSSVRDQPMFFFSHCLGV